MIWNCKIRLLSLFLIILILPGEIFGQVEFQGQVGKRWSEADGHVHVSNHSFVFSVHGSYPMNKLMSIEVGPSLAIDKYSSKEGCLSQACFSSEYYKIGFDMGTEFEFPLVSVFVLGRAIIHGWGRDKVWGRTSLSFPKTGPLTNFENGQQDGEFLYRTRGFDLAGGLKWKLANSLSCLLSFEFAYETQNIDQGNLNVESKRGDTLELSSSLRSDWHNAPSSAIFAGLSYLL